jgi:uncharacterized membrane protein YkvA (DUF1232 family)
MKPESETAESLMNSTRPGGAHFGQVSSSAWRIAGKTMTIDEYIENQSREVRSADLRVLQTFTDRLLDKLKETDAHHYTGLHEAVQVIVHVLESPAAQRSEDPLPTWLAETGFAAGYLLKRYDLLPDHLPGIGLADDVLILQRTIERNETEIRRSLPANTALMAANPDTVQATVQRACRSG